MKKLSIIIPVYNVEKYIEKCLMSCVSQGMHSSEYEVIVVNDGTPDNSVQIIERYVNEYDNIRIINQKNQGLSVARNTGLDAAKGKYVWFVDSDDWIAPHSLKIIFNIIELDNPDVIHFCAVNVFEDGIVERNKPYKGISELITGKDFLLHYYETPCAPFYICRRDILNQYSLRFYPDIFHEDSEFSPRMLYRTSKIRVINDILYYVYQNPASITRSVNYKKCFDCIIVSSNLWDFCRKEVIEFEVKSVLYNKIATCINTAIYETAGMPKDLEYKFNHKLKSNKHLFLSFWYSGRVRNRIEFLFFCLSSNYTKIYRVLQKMIGKR